jgi:predicted CXXCH cytochrome family protein
MNLHHNFAMIGVLLLSVAAWAQHAGEGLAKHNLNGQTCTACHAARSPSPPEETLENTCNKTLSWDCDLLTRTFQTYDVSVSSGKPAAPVPDESQVRLSSLLCASCHDGVSTLSMSGTAGFRSRGSTGDTRSLQAEHPIDVPYDPEKDPSLAALTIVSHQVKLFGQTNKVQCATCHNVHDSSDPKLLRAPNTNSSLCIACHL